MENLIHKLRQRNVLIILFILAILLLFFSFRSYESNRQAELIDALPLEGKSLNYAQERKTNIIDNYDAENGSLLEFMRSLERYERVKENLYYFAEKNYEKYKVPDAYIGFRVDSVATGENDEVYFSGRFGATANNIEVTIKIKKKNRFEISITDTKTGVNIDAELPANNLRESYIATLPLEADGYTISYAEDTDAFIVYVYNDPRNYEKALESIKDGLGVDNLDGETIGRLGLTGEKSVGDFF